MQDLLELMKTASKPQEGDLLSLMKDASFPKAEIPPPREIPPTVYEEEKPSFWQKIKDLTPKLLPFLSPEIQRPVLAGMGRAVKEEKAEIRQFPVEEVLPEKPTIRAMKPVEKEFQERAGLLYEMATAPERPKEEILEGMPWSKDPKVNYWSEKLAQHLPWWLTGFAAPGFVVAYEGLRQLPNIALSIKEKSKYDPLAQRHFAEFLSEDTPGWLKTGAMLGEEGVRLIVSGLAAGKISEKIFKKSIDKFFERAEKFGYPKEYLRDAKEAIRKYGSREGVRREIERMIDMSKEKIPSPITRRIGAPETFRPPVEPKLPGRLPEPAARLVTPRGTVIAPETPEAERLRLLYREAEVEPVEKVTIKINPTPEGGISVEMPKPIVPKVEPKIEEIWSRDKARLQKMIDEGKELVGIYKQVPKEMPVGEMPKKLIDYHESKLKEEAIPKEVPIAAEEARKVRLEELKRAEKRPPLVKEEPFEYSPELRKLEKELTEGKLKGKELTAAQKKLLEEREAYEFKKAPEKVGIPEVKAEELPKKKKMKLAKISITLPTGEEWSLGELPLERIKDVQNYAKKWGVEKNLKVGKVEEREWKEYLSPAQLEPFMRTMIRDVKTKPRKEDWEFYSGYPFTKEVKNAIARIQERQKIKKRVKRDELRAELQKTDEGKVEWMYIETQMQLKERRKPTFKKAFGGAKRALIDTSGNVKREMLKNLGYLGREATIRHDLIAGASAKADRLFEEASKSIYKALSKNEKEMLDRAIQSRRTIAISKYKPEHKHPLGLTAEEHAEYLKTIPKEINERADLYFKEMEKVLDELKSEGLIDAESYKNLKSKGDYSPRWFIQHIDPETTHRIGSKTITIPDSGIKRLDEGSYDVMEKDSRVLLESVIARTQGRIFRNRANKAGYDLAKEISDNGIFKLAKVIKTTKEGKPIYQPAPAGHTKIKVMIDGKAKEMIMPDKYANEWLTRDPLINEQLANIIGWLSGSKILKPMATGLNPGFALTNFPRDIAHVWIVTSEYSSVVPKFALQMGRDFMATLKDAWTRKGRWIDYIDEGGGMAFLTHQGRPFKAVAGPVKTIQRVLGYLGETSEIWTRLALRERAIRNGATPYEATWVARNYLDFSQGGNVSKALDAGIPYLNAGIQGTRGIFRAAADRPVDTLWKFAQLGALASGLYLANHYVHKDGYDRVTDRDKVNNFIIMTPYKIIDKNGNKRYFYFKIAKDQGQRIACTIFENLMKKAIGEKVDVDQLGQAVQDFIPIIPTEKTPPTMDAVFGYMANKDFWTWEDIWKREKRIPREEYTIYTHPALVKVGKATGLSPERLDYALSQLFTRGNIYTSLVSGGLSLIMKELPDVDKRKTLAEIVTRLPLIKRVARLTPPYSVEQLKELKKKRIEESTKKGVQRRELERMAYEYNRKLKDEKIKDRSIIREAEAFIRKQPEEDRKRLRTWWKNYGLVFDIPERTWWLNLAGMNPEARATVYWNKYLETPEGERNNLDRLAHKIPGFWSDRFWKRLKILRYKWRMQGK